MTATNASGETRSATGKRAFDPSWIYGAIQYATEVRSGGNVLETVKSEEDTRTILVPSVKSNQQLQVCSYYTWDKNSEGKSNEICQTINSGSLKVEMPNFIGKPVTEAQDWIRANSSAGITLKQQTPTSAQQVGQIISINPDYSGTETSQDVLDKANFTITYYDGEVTNLQSYVGRKVSNLKNDLGQYFTLVGPDDNLDAIITSITVNGQAINKVPIRPGTQIEFKVEAPSQPKPDSDDGD